MKTIEFDAPLGNRTMQVKLVSNDYGGGGYQILIDKYYHGEIVFLNGTWQAHLNAKSDLTGDDIAILGEVIENEQ
jgi:hypothetical protein